MYIGLYSNFIRTRTLTNKWNLNRLLLKNTCIENNTYKKLSITVLVFSFIKSGNLEKAENCCN